MSRKYDIFHTENLETLVIGYLNNSSLVFSLAEKDLLKFVSEVNAVMIIRLLAREGGEFFGLGTYGEVLRLFYSPVWHSDI